MRPPRALPLRRAATVVGCAVLCSGALTTAGAAALPAASSPTQVARAALTPRATAHDADAVKVFWRGNGHGHGLSQYGAHGAAMQGLSTAQILAFYYPGTTLVTVAPSTIRVAISEAGSTTTVFAGTKGLKLSGYGALPATGYTRFRLVPSGSGLRLDGLKAAKWATLKTGLPARADFGSALGWVQLQWADGSSTRYRGTVGAVRSGSSELTVNRVSLDQYVQGSVPREMPISWEPAAYHAQAVAARSYAESVRQYSGDQAYDICDTPSCQVYGGMTHYDSAGNVQWTDAPQAVDGNQNTVLRYGGQPVFAQYSASNGGATVDGGKPYLVGRTDPYDTAASGDPYLDDSGTASPSGVAHDLGLQSLSAITNVVRDGHGPWGGRVVSAKVAGTDWSGNAKTISVDGFDLGYALGAGTDYVRFDLSAPAPRTAPKGITATPGDGGARIAWAPPAGAAVTGYRVSFGSHSTLVPAGTRSLWVGPINNRTAATVSVRAVNTAGPGPAASVRVKGAAVARRLVPLAAQRLFDTRPKKAVIDATHPYAVDLAGLGDVPRTGARAVQLTVSVIGATDSGVLKISPAGVYDQPVRAVAYRAGHTTTTTVSVPFAPTSTIRFTPSAGRVQLVADALAYEPATGGSKATVIDPVTVADIAAVPVRSSALIDLSTVPGIASSPSGVVLAVDARGDTSGGLAVWPDGTSRPNVRHVTVSPYSTGTTTLVVPVGTSHRLRVQATAAHLAVRVRVVAVLGSTGGALVTYPPSSVADGAHVLTVDKSPQTVPVGGVNQVPASGVAAVLVHVTASGATAGVVVAHPLGTTGRDMPIARFPAGVTVTATALVRPGRDGAISLHSSVPGVHVAIDSIGYLTTR